MKKVTTVASVLLSVSVLAACGGTDGAVEDPAANDQALCASGPTCWPEPDPDPVPPTPTPKADLVAEIADGDACPFNNGDTITVRVKNVGNATAGKSVLRVRRYYKWNSVQFYDYSSYFRIAALAPGASTTAGVYLGDGVNGVSISNVDPNGGDGATFPVTSPITFKNAPWPTNASSSLLYFQLVADTSLPSSFFSWRDAQSVTHSAQISYSPSVSESNELNNSMGGATFCH